MVAADCWTSILFFCLFFFCFFVYAVIWYRRICCPRGLEFLENKKLCELFDYGSETWPMKVEHEVKVGRNEMSMLRWMCGFLKERKKEKYRTHRELWRPEPVSWAISSLVGQADYSGLDMLNVKVMQIGSSDVGHDIN